LFFTAAQDKKARLYAVLLCGGLKYCLVRHNRKIGHFLWSPISIMQRRSTQIEVIDYEGKRV